MHAELGILDTGQFPSRIACWASKARNNVIGKKSYLVIVRCVLNLLADPSSEVFRKHGK